MNVNTQYYFKGEWRERNEIFNMLDAPIVKVGKFEYYGTCDDGRKTLAIVKYKGEYKLLTLRDTIVHIVTKGGSVEYDIEKGRVK